jgi:Domain of unknown function (DUF4190)
VADDTFPPHDQGWADPPAPPSGAPSHPLYALAGYQNYGMVVQRASTNGLAIASFVLSLLWMFWIGSILAVIFGHVALSQTKDPAHSGGRGLAMAGLVIGYAAIGFFAFFVLIGLMADASHL